MYVYIYMYIHIDTYRGGATHGGVGGPICIGGNEGDRDPKHIYIYIYIYIFLLFFPIIPYIHIRSHLFSYIGSVLLQPSISATVWRRTSLYA